MHFELVSNLPHLAFHIFPITWIKLILGVSFKAKLYSSLEVFQVYSGVTKGSAYFVDLNKVTLEMNLLCCIRNTPSVENKH